MRVWIDLTNSPHVLVMRPVIANLRSRGHEVEVTARDFAQTLELCERFEIEHTAIGRHRGGHLAGARRVGLAVALARAHALGARAGGFDLALGHGSNDVTVAAALLRIPRSTMFDYEWATVQHNVNCRLCAGRRRARRDPARASVPLRSAGQDPRLRGPEGGVLPGGLRAGPDGARRARPGRRATDRGRADAAGRCRCTTDSRTTCSPAVLERLRDVQTVVLPRTPEQRAELERAGGFIVPEHAIDAQSLIAYADLVVSAGGTMNREAVALGTPVFTVFEGRLGAVDERLIAEGRLRRLMCPDDVEVVKRDRARPSPSASGVTRRCSDRFAARAGAPFALVAC